jgi:hypothetical protein
VAGSAATRGVPRRAGAPGRPAARPCAGLLLAAAVLVAAAAPGHARVDEPREPVELGHFTPPLAPDTPPPGWEALTFPRIARHTRYTVERDGTGGTRQVLRADSQAGASGLYRPVDLDPRVYQVLTWRWKITDVVARADARTRAGDDYAARVYVGFRYDPTRASLWERARYGAYRLIYGRYPPGLALAYVWDNRLPPGTVLPNAYTDRVRMIVAQSGSALAGQWVGERRNVYEDYRRIVGGEPPRIEGVAVMTDTDDTGDSAVAWYDALTFRPGG